MFVTTINELKRRLGKTITLHYQGEADSKDLENRMTLLDDVNGLSLYLNGMDNEVYYVDSENKLYKVLSKKVTVTTSALKEVESLSQLDKKLREGKVTFGEITSLETLESVNNFMQTHLVLDAGRVEETPDKKFITRALFKNMNDVFELEALYDEKGSFLHAIVTAVEKI